MTLRNKVFISYSSKDKDEVHPIVERLRNDGLVPWLDEWDMRAGVSIVPAIAAGIEQSELMVCFVSKNSQGWQWFEVGGVLLRKDREDRVVPVRLDESRVPDFMLHLKYIDWYPDVDRGYATLLESYRRVAAASVHAQSAHPPLRLEDILGLCNSAALSLYNQYVLGRSPVDVDVFDRPRDIIAGSYWHTAEYNAQKHYVSLRRADNPEFIQQKACQLLAEGFFSGADTHIWLVGEAGTGKTTATYRIYFEILQALDRAARESQPPPYPIPLLIQLQKIQRRLIEQLRATSAEPDFIAAVFDIWLRRRHFDIAEDHRQSLHAAFYSAVRDGKVVLLIDSYDELGRLAAQLDVFEQLFAVAKYYVAATRPELYREDPQHQTLRIQPTWDVSTIRSYLDRVFAETPDVARGLAASIERNDNSRWLRNPRYLHLLGVVVNRRLRSGDTSGSIVLQLVENGQYSLLATLYNDTIERLRTIWPTDSDTVGRADPFERQVRLHLQRIAQSQVETGSLEISLNDPDRLWNALADHASEIVGRRTDFTSTDDQFYLVSYNWVDFFLADIVMHDLEASPSRALSLPHLWTQTLLTYAAELAKLTNKVRHLAQRIRERIAQVQKSKPLTPPQGIRDNYDVNLVQLLTRLLAPYNAGEVNLHTHDTCFHDENFSNLSLNSIDFYRLSFRRCNFSNTELTRANLERAQFDECNFAGADLRRANADHATFMNCVFVPDRQAGDTGESSVFEMSIQGATVKSYGEDLEATFKNHGAIAQRSRYHSPFGKLFFGRQRQMLGAGFDEAESKYLSEIAGAVRSFGMGPKHLLDLMAGGGNERLIELLGRDANLFVLAIDRDGRDLNEVVNVVGQRFAMIEKEIDDSTNLVTLIADYFDPPTIDIVIAKKAMHELPRHTQGAILRSIAEVLHDGGRLILFTDSPYEIDAPGRERLARLRELLVVYKPTDLGPLRTDLLNLSFDPSSRSDLAVFSNLWVHLKDWANGNDRELRNRYFSGAHEIIEWAGNAGLRQIGAAYESSYHLVAKRFNEAGYNLARHRLQESHDQIETRDIGFYREVLEGTERFRLFCEVVEHHLWDAGRAQPTALGAALNARRTALDLHELHPTLRTDAVGLSYDSGIGFDFTIHVLTFERERRA